MITLSAPLACPDCGGKVTGKWTADEKTADQRCRCGHVFTATWPGFPFESPTIVISGSEAGAERAFAPHVNARSNSRAASRDDAGETGFSGQSDRTAGHLS